MKILSLKALNINSLKGKTEINFAEITKDSSLFAITGPTGSGKSSILDIISCALYGRTSRLKNPNDLMSRHCGEAYCEVEFEIRGKMYRSSWAQKRARKKYDGAFQSAKMELVDLDEDKILFSKSREVVKKIEELSGLDFGRFTQSMLLAQGGFDAFLKADEKERSALLEKITGTQIYAEISKAIFEKHRDFAQDMEIDQNILESITLLDETLVEQKQEQLSQNTIQKKETDKELKELSLALTWLQRFSELSIESKKHEEDFLEVSKVKEEHKSSFEKLDLANKALNVSVTYSSYTQLEKSVTVDKTISTKYKDELVGLDKEIKLRDNQHATLKKELDIASEIFEEQEQKLKLAREIQTQEKQTQTTITKAETTLKNKKESLKEFSNTLNVLVLKHKDFQKQVENEMLYLKSNKQDENLLSVLGVVTHSIKLYKEEKEELVKNENALLNATKNLESEELQHKRIELEVKEFSKVFQEIETEYKKLEEDTLAETKQEEGTHKSLEETQVLMRTFESYVKFVSRRKNEVKEHEKNSELYDSLLQTQKVSQEYIGNIKKHIETLRDKKDKEQLLKKYEDDRKNLVAGEACSLCGSTEHPFVNALDEVSIDTTQELITKESEELQDKENQLKSLESRISVTQTKLETSLLEMQKLNLEIETLEVLFEKHSFKLTSESETKLKEQEERLTQQLQRIKQNRIKKDEVLKQRDKAREAFEVKEKSLNQLGLTLQKYISVKEQLSLLLASNALKIEELTKATKKHFKEFGLDLDVNTLEVQHQELVRRKDVFEKTLKDLKILEDTLHKCSVDKKESEIRTTSLTVQIQTDTQALQELASCLKELSTKKIDILNVADLDAYESSTRNAYKGIETKEQVSKSSLENLLTKYEERDANKKSLDKKILEEESKLELLRVRLEELYKQHDFKDAEDLENATLSTDKKDELNKLCQSIQDRYKQAQTLKIQTTQKLQEHEKEPVSTKPIKELETLQVLLSQKVDALQENIGSQRRELEINQENSDKHKTKIAELEKKKESFKVWVKLNELVGSADGGKFKKFAQGITLDQLISLANQHLCILSSRYTLERNQDKLLELEVIDAYQGNVVRSVNTLSGGESFIVSLALALGLSELASQKIAIDSLFLDEGFGTLDEESLETALNALNLLQNGGKMVGVISHVEALKERIPLQIRVVPNGDGTSFVEVEKS